MTETRRHTFPANVLPREIGDRLRELRRTRRMSTASLSDLTGVARETITRIETGLRPPRADTVLRLLKVLLAAQDDIELEDIVPGWPEADASLIVGQGPRSRVRRRQLGRSAAAVAEAAGISEATLSRFERNTGPTPSLLKASKTPHGDLIFGLKSELLALALCFAGLEDHEAFCDAEEWTDWPVAHP